MNYFAVKMLDVQLIDERCSQGHRQQRHTLLTAVPSLIQPQPEGYPLFPAKITDNGATGTSPGTIAFTPRERRLYFWPHLRTSM